MRSMQWQLGIYIPDALRIFKSSYGKLFNTDEVTSVMTIVDRCWLLSVCGMNNAKFVNGQ